VGQRDGDKLGRLMPINVDDIATEQAHLKDALVLFKKVIAFNNAVKDVCKDAPLSVRDVSYCPGVVAAIFEIFSYSFGIPNENIEALKEAVRLSNIDFTRLPLNEIPSFSLPYHEDELRMILFIISRPFFLMLNELSENNEEFRDDGRCSVCGGTPSLSYITGDNRRKLSCSFCGNEGFYRRIGCPVCLNADTSLLDIISADGEKGCRVDTCKRCGSYIKTFDESIIVKQGTDMSDVLTMPFDVVAQERGFYRKSPNPLGISKII
jgi:FdhE protein